MLKRWVLLSGLLTTLALVSAQPFTYQGVLKDGGNPANGNYQMTFRLYDAAAGGTPLGTVGPVTVPVSNGLFSVELNFPASVWDGGTRYLEIQVGSTVLSPRVKMNPTPYASALRMFESGTSNPDRMVITHSPAFTNWGLQYRDSDDSFHFLAGGTSRVRIGLGDGRVGIGTATPAHALDVLGDVRWSGTLQGGSVPWARVTGAPSFLDGSGTANRIARFTAANTLGDSVIVQSGSNIGINNAAPIAPLSFASTTGNKISLWGSNASAHYGFGIQGYLLQIYTDANSSDIAFGYGSSASFTETMRVKGNGNVGIGTNAPTARLHVQTNSSGTYPTLRLHETEADFARIEFTNTNTARRWHIGGIIGATQAADQFNIWNSAAGDILSARGDGTVAVKVLEITGADFAEKFPTTDEAQPGMVVEIDPDNPGHLRLARGAYNKRVAGIVAGANGLSKGIVLGNLEGSENHSPIAISGRVWVYADATEQAIIPGDFLTTADRPGYAMKATDLQKAQGAILGKAMTRLEKGQTGFVLVLVNLQ